MFGRKHSPESIALMSARRTGKAQGNKNAAREQKVGSYYWRHRERILEKQRCRRSDPDFMAREIAFKRDHHLRIRYGISAKDYDVLLAKQGGKCAICSTSDPGTKRAKYFDVDHCHTTGKVRALLCRNCNVTVGVVEKKTELIKLIHEYLREHNDVRRKRD